MKIVSFLFIVSIFSAGIVTSERNYFALISNVHKYFSTSCVFVVHSRQESDEEIYRIQLLLRQFSAERVLTVAVQFTRLRETMNFYSKRAVKSLIVVSLRTREIINRFSNLTKHFEMGKSYWLLLFDENVYRDNYKTITKPGDNNFHLKFDTEMLVARSNNSIVQEWYWLQNRVKIEDLAVWDFGTGFSLNNNYSLYQRRTNLERTKIIVTTVNNPPMTSFANNTMGGLFGRIFGELSRVANCNVEFIKPDEMSYGSWNDEEKKWSGMIKMLVEERASIAAADFTITTPRLEWVDFSLPLISTRDVLYIRKPDAGICWSSYWQALAPGIWIVIQIFIIFTTVLLTFITAVRRYKITPDVFTGYFLLVFGIYCQQGLPEFPIDLPSRIAYFSIFLSALIVSAAYSATLTSFLTVTGINLPFTTLEEFVSDATYKLIVFRDGAEFDMFTDAKDPTLARMSRMLENRSSLPTTLMGAFDQVCKRRVAFYIPAVLEETIRVLVPCKIIGIETQRSMSLAMALSKGNPYHGLINYHVQRFRDHGILDRLKHEFAVGHNPPTTVHADVTLWGILPILAILGIGIILATFILYWEIILYAKFQSKGSIDRVKERHKFKAVKSEEILKIRLRKREEYLTHLSNFYP